MASATLARSPMSVSQHRPQAGCLVFPPVESSDEAVPLVDNEEAVHARIAFQFCSFVTAPW
jgi:hypothetical protein